jgi:hypothetical protein
VSGYFEPSIKIVSWSTAASTLNLCDRCHAAYTDARFCEDCLRQADADIGEKRDILFPQAYDAADALSAIA